MIILEITRDSKGGGFPRFLNIVKIYVKIQRSMKVYVAQKLAKRVYFALKKVAKRGK